jgi:MFS superfamily sulfate permease-like transporter
MKAWLVPATLRGYQRSWLPRDVVAGVTLAAVAIPEVMGYTTIARTPVITGLYTVIFPTAVFALLGSSRLLVVGADSATAAILAAGLGSLSIAGLTPDSPEWVAWCSLTALVCAAMLVLARLLRLGFLGDFLSASVLIGFLTGVGIQVLTGQIPTMLGVPKGSGNWFQQQWDWIKEIPHTQLATLAFALGTIAIIQGFKQFLPRIPGAVVAVILSIVISVATDASSHGVAVVGDVQGGFPPVGLPSGITWSDVPKVVAIAFSCFVLIIAQSAATSRSFAMKHGQRVDVNRDIVGLAGASAAAGLTGTFVVNGSPTKTQILDSQKGRTQLANLTMALVVLIVTLFLTGLLTEMPKAVLGAIVFLIGVELVDVLGMTLVARQRRSEFVIAALTAVIVFAIGVEQGIIAAIVLSLLDLVRRQYQPRRFVVTGDAQERGYLPVRAGTQTRPGLIVFRYDADLFYANSNRFVDDAEKLVEGAPDPVQLFVLDCSGLSDIDFSASRSLLQLVDYLHAHGAEFGIAGADQSLVSVLSVSGVMDRVSPGLVFPTVADALAQPIPPPTRRADA